MSPDFTPTQVRLNDLLTQQLKAAGCWGGRLQMRPTGGASLVSLSGHHHSGKDVVVFPIGLPLKRALGQYVEEMSDRIGFLTIDADLPQHTYQYHHISAGAQAQADAQAEAAEKKASIERQQEYHAYLRQHLATTPFGAALAARVADALALGRPFNYSHRDYCGTGFDYHVGSFRYGEVWDYTFGPLRTFASKSEFEAWLAQQSDASLARHNEKDAFYWNNQTVTQQRLEDFVR